MAGHDEAWIARVATNLALGRWRRRRPTVVFDDRHADAVPAVDGAVLDRLGLVDALSRLPRRQLQVVALRYLADLPEREVAAAMNTSVGTVKQHTPAPSSSCGSTWLNSPWPRRSRMLDHLDDPQPSTPDAAFCSRVEQRGRRLRRRHRLSGLAVGLAVLAVLAGSGLLYVERRDAAIDRVNVVSQPSAGGAVDVLLVGTDGQPGVEGQRADAMVVLRFELDGSVRMLVVAAFGASPCCRRSDAGTHPSAHAMLAAR